LEGLSVGVIVADLQGCITVANRAARQLLELQNGVKGKGVVGELSGRISSHDVEILTSGGGEKGVVAVECSLKKRSGEILHLTLRSHPLLDPSGVELGMLLTLEDFTELRSMEEEVARSQRLAAMGEMAASIVHEVRNPLGSIQLFASLMAQEPSEQNREEIMNQIHSAIGTVDHILANLLTFARPYKPRLSRLDPCHVLEECSEFIRPLTQQRHIEIVLEIPKEMPRIEADRDLLKQALLNILLNAVQAMPGGGGIRTWMKEISTPFRGWEGTEGQALPRWLEIGVCDSGEGIPRHVLPSVFDPFFTTRTEGTGLGLAIVHKISRAHGGSVNIQSDPGEGTCVRMWIPIERSER
jgi:signal transduction histidine kinase